MGETVINKFKVFPLRGELAVMYGGELAEIEFAVRGKEFGFQ